MPTTISGFGHLEKQLEEAQQAFSDLDDALTVSFEPDDQASVAAAIATMESAVQRTVAEHRGNPMIHAVAEKLKEQYRAIILERANRASI